METEAYGKVLSENTGGEWISYRGAF